MGRLKSELSATLKAMGRTGAKDLHNAIVPAFPESQRTVDEPGMPLSPTQHEVYEQKQPEPEQQPEIEMENE